MELQINQTKLLTGKVTVPASKSQSIRALFFALLANGKSTLNNVLKSEDVNDAIRICQMFGAKITSTNGKIILESLGAPFNINQDRFNTGNSGITTKFALPLLGLRQHYQIPVIFDCGEQMRLRPIKSLIDALRNLGMEIEYIDQPLQLPVSVRGQLKGGETEVDGLSSQYLSALLIALPCAELDSVITVNNLHERPYVEMTLNWLRKQNIVFEHQKKNGSDIFKIKGKQNYKNFTTTLSGDFSSASCLIAASAMIEGEVEICGLDMEDTQGDKKILSILQEMGADIRMNGNSIVIKGGKPLKGKTIDAIDIPDLVPALAAVATQAIGQTHLKNVKQARFKETDRLHSMTQGLQKMGATIVEHEDGMTIHGSKLHGATVDGFGDHRTVMALCTAALSAEGMTLINDAEAINKTYPNFIQDMQSLQAQVEKKGEDIFHHVKHIILIGFKHVGKTRIGQRLSQILQKPFIDLDEEIANEYAQMNGTRFTCRQIMERHGEAFYREFESNILKNVLMRDASVISLGGGTPLAASNQALIKNHFIVNVSAPAGIVFERIMVTGRPAFFDANEDPYESFIKLWNERTNIYKQLTPLHVENDHTVDISVKTILTFLHQKKLAS
ncbi:MAG: 3-phosphoshikimate 1-carboxyvinyltransferase, partial [Gammaproteobacteria bacterium]|nr:3-phosphoshikimate 1-carboxyvinyltransferase [Gammaproteobacteria bacterium]